MIIPASQIAMSQILRGEMSLMLQRALLVVRYPRQYHTDTLVQALTTLRSNPDLATLHKPIQSELQRRYPQEQECQPQKKINAF